MAVGDRALFQSSYRLSRTAFAAVAAEEPGAYAYRLIGKTLMA